MTILLDFHIDKLGPVPDDQRNQFGMQRCPHCGKVQPMEVLLCWLCDSYLHAFTVPSKMNEPETT